MYETLKNDGINYQPQLVIAGFEPSTACVKNTSLDESWAPTAPISQSSPRRDLNKKPEGWHELNMG